jgi:hypothetical protein
MKYGLGQTRGLAESFASLQPMKSLNEDKSISVAANKYRRFLPNLQHVLGDLADSLRPECGPSFHRDIDFGDWEVIALEHRPYLFGRGLRGRGRRLLADLPCATHLRTSRSRTGSESCLFNRIVALSGRLLAANSNRSGSFDHTNRST